MTEQGRAADSAGAYTIDVLPIALRAFVPEWALDLGLVTLAAGVAWLAGWLWVWTASTGNSTADDVTLALAQ
jgi:hypothetical protein